MQLKRNKKAFTIIELLVVIAILGILVLMAGPKFLGYVQKAELVRIQHDVKVMENKMGEVLVHSDDDFPLWENNGKDLGTLILRNQLFEKEGLAKRVSIKHLLSQNGKSANPGKEKVGMGGELYEVLGVGGEEHSSITNPSASYKIIPETFKKQIGTRLDGTFYANELGKVYYEPNKPFSSIKQEQPLACVAAETLDYEFDGSTGTIIKYHGTLQYINIPAAFEVDGECIPVRIIGKGAFMRGGFIVVKIPQTVKIIEEDAFRDNDLKEIEIPHSVDTIGPNAFTDNKLESVVIKKSPGDIIIREDAFNNNGPTGKTTVTPTYKTPTVEDLGVLFDKSTGTIVGSSRNSSKESNSSEESDSSSSGGSGSSSKKNYDNSDKVISIPEKVVVGGEEHKIKEIAKGAFQGQGIIYVEFPNTLERIGDYAFAGNQLIGVEIPINVGHIGNYAFAFNEVTHTITGHKKPSIKFINIQNEEQSHKVNQYGDIYENGKKVDLLKSKVELLNHIFVTSTGKVVIEEPIESTKPVDKSGLQSKLSEANGLKEVDYVSGWEELQNAISEASKVVNKTNATKEETATAIENLNTAIAGLTKKPTLPVVTDAEFTWVPNAYGYNSNEAGKGYYKYTGSATEVKIPHTIKGNQITSYYRMFYKTDVTKVVSDNQNITDMSYMFQYSQAAKLDLSSLDTSNVTDMSKMFQGSWATSIIGLNKFDTSKVINMERMFDGCRVTELDLSSFDTSNVISMQGMFNSSRVTELDLSLFDTSNVTNMGAMFAYSSTTSIIGLNKFNTSKVTNMGAMFFLSRVTELDLSLFDTSNVTNMGAMFSLSKATELNLSSFDTSKVTSMEKMFSSSLATSLDLSSFDTSNVTNMEEMFSKSQATKGYARTRTDATKLNGSSAKPAGLTFVLKP